MSKIKGTQAIIKCLQEEGVEVIFGYPGGAVIELYDELCKSGIRHILVRHEQARFNKGVVLLTGLNDRPGALVEWKELIRRHPMAAAPSGRMVGDLIDELEKAGPAKR